MASHQNKQLPRDVLVIQNLLKEMGVSCYEPRVVNQMLEFVYRYVTQVVEEARVYSSYAKKKNIDADDVKLAIKMVADKSYCTVPPREMLLEMAKQKNSTPLPLLKASTGLRLPPDRFCLTQPNYKLQFYKRAIASSSSQASSSGRASSNPVFKAPIHIPARPAAGTPSASASASVPPSVPTISVPSSATITVGVKRKHSDDSDDTIGGF